MNPASTAPATTATACPETDELSAFVAGRLSAPAFDSVAEHVKTCATCADRLGRLTTFADHLLSDLISLRDSAALADDSKLEQEMTLLEHAVFLPSRPQENGVHSHPAVDLVEARGAIGEYKLLERLGEGGMGAVYKAVHQRLDKVVALKVLSRHRLADSNALARFHREMKAVGRLNHSNIVQATDAGEADGTHFLVMECVEGTDASRLVNEHGPLPIADACEIVRQAAIGLHYAHQHGLVHRDVKPSNLLLSTAGQVKIADLGMVLSHLPESAEDRSTTSQYLLGSFDYMAPEQGDDPHAVDARADVYSLGCTLFHLLTGQPPFATKSPQGPLQKLRAHASAEPPPMRSLRSEIPERLAMIVSRLLAKNPKDRYTTAGEVADALAPFSGRADLARLLRTMPRRSGEPNRKATTSQESDDLPPVFRCAVSTQVRRRPAWFWAGMAALAAAVFIAAGAVIYVQTDHGVVEVRTDDDEIKISVERGGKFIEILDLQKNKNYRLASGSYDFKIVAGEQDFEIKPRALILKRGDTAVVTIRRLDGKPVVHAPSNWPTLDAAWLKSLAPLTGQQKADAVVKELVRRNPELDQQGVQVRLENGSLNALIFRQGANLFDLTPLRGAPELKSLGIFNSDVADLTPLKGLSLEGLDLFNTKVTDLTPIKGMMKLTYLNANGSRGIKDLTPLMGMAIEVLDVSNTSVADLAPLTTLGQLRHLGIGGAKVKDFGPLPRIKNLEGLNCSGLDVADVEMFRNTRLVHLEIPETQVKDLSPLKTLPLKFLNIKKTPVTDLSPLRGMPLEVFHADLDLQRDGDVMRSWRKLREVNGKPAAQIVQ